MIVERSGVLNPLRKVLYDTPQPPIVTHPDTRIRTRQADLLPPLTQFSEETYQMLQERGFEFYQATRTFEAIRKSGGTFVVDWMRRLPIDTFPACRSQVAIHPERSLVTEDDQLTLGGKVLEFNRWLTNEEIPAIAKVGTAIDTTDVVLAHLDRTQQNLLDDRVLFTNTPGLREGEALYVGPLTQKGLHVASLPVKRDEVRKEALVLVVPQL